MKFRNHRSSSEEYTTVPNDTCSDSVVRVDAFFFFFFFQAEDGIRDVAVTGVQTCALPISWRYTGPANLAQRQALAAWLAIAAIRLRRCFRGRHDRPAADRHRLQLAQAQARGPCSGNHLPQCR